uniref:Uncharacterized protein n=1 Tax=Arundo donax TaxID=35708 RepID=A0A0A9HHE7_ARUDO
MPHFLPKHNTQQTMVPPCGGGIASAPATPAGAGSGGGPT